MSHSYLFPLIIQLTLKGEEVSLILIHKFIRLLLFLLAGVRAGLFF